MLQNGEGTYTPGVSQHGSGGSAFFAADALGSTRGITGSTGAATDSLVYDAFGETLTRSGSTATPVQFAGASGYQADAATGLMLLGHRYYDASVGRFLSSDPAQAGSNWYAYCDNNPLVRVDPTGLDAWWKKAIGIGGAVWGFTKTTIGKDLLGPAIDAVREHLLQPIGRDIGRWLIDPCDYLYRWITTLPSIVGGIGEVFPIIWIHPPGKKWLTDPEGSPGDTQA